MLFNMLDYSIEICLALTIGLFIPLNIYILNDNELNFPITQVILLFIIVSFLCFIILFIISFILNKFSPIATIAFKLVVYGLMFGFFIQAYFINPNYGVLDGHSINWDNYTTYGIINTVIWICCLLIPFILWYFINHDKFNTLSNIAIIIIFCQCIQVVYNYYHIDIKEKTQYALSEEHILDVSKNKNIIIFILDAFQTDFFSDIIKKHPKVATDFCDFVYYPDTIGMYPTTDHALPLILFGKPYYNDMPWKEYISSNWKNNTFYNILNMHNFDINLFTVNWDLHKNAKNISNLYAGYYKINSEIKFIRDFYKLSFFVCMPHFIKNYFVLYTEEINNNSKFIVKNTPTTSVYHMDNGRFFNNLNNRKMTINKNKNKFMLYHIQGAHPPYTLNSKSQLVERSTREEQCLGTLNIVLRYIQLLKENNVYDSTTMIIMADHGSHEQHLSAPLFLVKSEFHKSNALEISDASLSYEDIHSLFLYFSGLSKETSNGKENIFHRKKRLFYDYIFNGLGKERYLKQYIINGKVGDIKSWHEVRFIPIYGKKDNSYILGTDIFTIRSKIRTSIKYCVSGWDWMERTSMWTNAHSSELEFSIKHGAKKDLLLSVDLVPFIKKGNSAQLVTVFANGSKVAEWNIPTGGVYTALIPASVMETDTLHIRFDIAHPAMPRNDQSDKRLLGIAVKRLSIDLANKRTVNQAPQKNESPDFSKIPYYELGIPLSFGEKDAAVNARHKINGWSWQERWGTWTEGKNIELAFCVKKGAGKKLTLELKGHPCLRPGLAAQRVAVFANDVPIAEWNISTAGVFTAEIPAEAMKSEFLCLRLAIADPVRPCEIGASGDIRELGIGVTELTLHDRAYVLGESVLLGNEKANFERYRLQGWYAPAKTHTWSEGASSELEFSVKHGAKRDLLFSVDLVPFIKKGNAAQEVTVFANGSKVAEWNIPTGGVYTALIPASVMETDKLHIRFDIASPSSPENDKSDSRLLGIAVRRLSIDLADKRTGNQAPQKTESPDFSKIPYYELGIPLSFGEKDAADNALHKINGWSWQEPWGTWTEGKTAELAFHIREEAGQNLTLELNVHPYLKPGLAYQRVAVFANDVPIAEWNISRNGVFRAEIPAGAMKSDLLRLRLSIADPARPCENGANGDIREIGIFVTELTLRAR